MLVVACEYTERPLEMYGTEKLNNLTRIYIRCLSFKDASQPWLAHYSVSMKQRLRLYDNNISKSVELCGMAYVDGVALEEFELVSLEGSQTLSAYMSQQARQKLASARHQNLL